MRLVIEKADFRRLSPQTRKELLETFAGKGLVAAKPEKFAAKPEKFAAKPGKTATKLSWRRPVDLTPAQALKLVHGLPEDHRRRLELFARKGGRVKMKEIMAVTGDRDLRPSSDFQKAMTRRLRRMIDDPDKKAQLIGWDFEATKWDDKQTTIVDGVYYVTETTSKALKACLASSEQ